MSHQHDAQRPPAPEQLWSRCQAPSLNLGSADCDLSLICWQPCGVAQAFYCGGFLDVLHTDVCPSCGPLPLHHTRPVELGVLHLKYPSGVPDLG